jgi:hypothetical protein
MSTLSVEIWDSTGSKRRQVELPADAQVDRLVAVLIDRMGLPDRGPDGQILSYKIHHRASGTQLVGKQSLSEAGVNDGDVLRLQPEITAGGP